MERGTKIIFFHSIPISVGLEDKVPTSFMGTTTIGLEPVLLVVAQLLVQWAVYY